MSGMTDTAFNPAPGPALASQQPARAMTPGEETLSRLTNDNPETWPEVLREATLLAGATDALWRTVEELVQRLAHVTLDADIPHPMPAAPLSGPPASTPLGEKLHATYEQASDTQRRLMSLMARLAV